MWFTLALASAASGALLILICKRLVNRIDPIAGTFLGYSFSVLFLLVILVAENGFSTVSWRFLELTLYSGALDAAAHALSFIALRSTPVSLFAPVTAFTPVLMVGTSYIFLHESPTPLKLLGILVIVAGAYLLNLRHGLSHWLEPFQVLLKNRGVQLVLITSLIWSFTPVVQKQQIFETNPASPVFAALASFSVMCLLLAPIGLPRLRLRRRTGGRVIWLAVAFGLAASIGTATGWTAISLVNPSYVSALGKLSIVFSSLLAVWLLREKLTRARTVGIATMTVGAILLAL